MTSRFFRRDISWDDLSAATGLVPPPGVEAPPGQYNIAPSQGAPILRVSAPNLYEGDYAPRDEVILAPAFWGLVPPWWNKPLTEKTWSSHACSAERITISKTFSGAFRQGRCLVPASGFYAWSGPKGSSTPFALGLSNASWFCFAGLWSRAMINGSEFDTFAIVTCAPNDTVAGLAASMPVILHQDYYARWLDPMARHPFTMLRPYPAAGMRAWPANPAVGNVRNDGVEMLGEQPA